jgi:hypothetical protein
VHDAAAPKPPLISRLFIFVVGLVAVAAIAATAWVYAETQRDIVRISTDIAQIKLSLELYGRQSPGDAAPAASSDQLLDLSNRIAILEQNWRDQPPSSADADTSRVPALPADGAATGGPQSDCMPAGTRFLASAGDSYPICGTPGVVDVTTVEASHVTFTDGTIVPAGGSAILKGTNCTLAVVSSGADGMTGYAELRVGC